MPTNFKNHVMVGLNILNFNELEKRVFFFTELLE